MHPKRPFINALTLLLTFGIFGTLFGQDQRDVTIADSYDLHHSLKESSVYQLEWIPHGPTLNSARVEAVQADPNRPGTFFVAFGSGGLWKTINNGMSWQPIFENMPVLGIGDFALAPSNPDIIYAGTGESLKKPRNFTMPGNGVYRSDDGGTSWKHLGLNDTWHIGEIVIHPENPDIVLVAALGHFWSSNTERGIFRTEDGGTTWEHVLYIDEHTGANDIVFSPADPSIVYATMWENFPYVNGAKSGVYVSKDGGRTWDKQITGIHIVENTGRIGIAASYQDPQKAYIFVDQRNRDPEQGAGEIYKTVNGGKSWIKTHDQDIESLSVIGWYFMDIYVNPKDDEEIFALGVRLLHSTDGGRNFDFIGGQVNHLTPSPAQTLHLDHCELWINPENPYELILGNDGGVFHSYDKGESWLHLNNLPTGEFYDIELGPGDPYTIYGGTQDNSTVYGSTSEWNPQLNDPWKYLWIDAWSGGDGCITLVDPNDSNTLYFSMQNGGARRMDVSADTSVSIRPRFPKEDSIQLVYNFITPYMRSSHHTNRLYMAGNYVMKSDNQGDDWQMISPDLVEERKHKLTETAAGAMTESPFDPNTLYVGTDRGTFWITEDGGRSWLNRSDGLPYNYIRSIVPSIHQEGRIYIQLTGLNYDDFGAYLFVSDNNGQSWKSITGNLPNQPINTVLEDPLNENILFTGTYRGVYISLDRGLTWSSFGKGMPDVSIADLIIDRVTQDLVVATHGRGIYSVNLQPVYDGMNQTGRQLFSPPVAYLPKLRDTHGDVEASTISKVPISWYSPENEAVELIIQNKFDSIIWMKSLLATKGFNQYRWNLVVKEEESLKPYFIHYQKFIMPGEYQLILDINGRRLSEPFKVEDKLANKSSIKRIKISIK